MTTVWTRKPLPRPKLRKSNPYAAVLAALDRLGARVEDATTGPTYNRWYAYAPKGMVWASDPEIHVMMIFGYTGGENEDWTREDVASWLKYIGMGLVPCPAGAECPECNAAEIEEARTRARLSLDSARL